MEEKLVLIDTDAGTDDAWGIFMALAAHKDPKIPFRVVGITCTQGNTSVDNVTVNVTRILNTVGVTNIPVYRGADSGLVFSLDQGEDPWFGDDGFGDAGFPPIQPILEPGHAANKIVELAEEYKGKLSILALGPLTNLAMAVRLQPNINKMVKEIYILGGTYQGLGNMTMLAEFNFLGDAEAVHIVLENFIPCPMFICPWETCILSYSTYSFRMDTLGKMGTPVTELMNPAEAKLLEKEFKPKNRWLVPDPLVVSSFLESAVVKKTMKCYCTIELGGNHARGMMVADKGFLQEKPPNCTIITEIDLPLYEKMLIWSAGGPDYKIRD